MNERYKNIGDEYSSGMSTVQLAQLYGVSRQVIWKVLRARKIQMRPHVMPGDKNHKWKGGGRGPGWSRNVLNYAVLKGHVKRQPCEVCMVVDIRDGGIAHVEAHHDDYKKPLDVRWLCQVHHGAWHAEHTAKNKDWKPGRYSRARYPRPEVTPFRVRGESPRSYGK